MKTLYGLTPKEITKELDLEKTFQGKQIFEWLNRGIFKFSEMSNLSKYLRKELEETGSAISSKVIEQQRDDTGAVKLLIELSDNKLIEAVLLQDGKGAQTACISSQVGCAMGCKFCRTGTMKLIRNLTDYEIIEQFYHLMHLFGKIEHIVFMGMGEPLANVEEVIKALQYFHEPSGLNMSYRRITVSTCGVVPGMKRLQESGLPVKLAVSLVSADETIRSSLMPINRNYDLHILKNAIIEYQRQYKRRVTFECCLLSGINTDAAAAKKLYYFCKNIDVVINLIPYNEVEGLNFKTPSEEEVDVFCSYLDECNLTYTRRISRGRDVNGACGQLAVSQQK